MPRCTTRSVSRSTCSATACAAGGDRARAANYTAAVGVDDGRVVLRDSETGAETPFAASVVVNASGPWTDLTNLALGDPTHHMGGTKGSHIVLDHPELLAATGGRELFFEHKDGRIVLIYPLKGRVLVGTTDLEHDMPRPDRVHRGRGRLLHRSRPARAARHHGRPRSQIVYRFSGVRPLPGHGDLAPGFVSRDYRIDAAPLDGRTDATVLSLVGGKWTTFRASAEHLADEVLAPARPAAATLHEGRADRRRARIPDHRARAAAVDRRAQRGPARWTASRRCSTATARSPPT